MLGEAGFAAAQFAVLSCSDPDSVSKTRSLAEDHRDVGVWLERHSRQISEWFKRGGVESAVQKGARYVE